MKSIKTFSILLSAILTFSLASTTYGQDINEKSMASGSITTDSGIPNQNNSKISKEDAKTIAKKTLIDYFGITIDDTLYQTNVNFTPYYRNGINSKDYVWQISWNSNNQEKNVNINVTISANSGKVINVDNYSSVRGQTSTVAILTEDEAKKIGESFLNKINPQEFLQCKLVDNNQLNNLMKGNASVYNFSYSRIANSIPFLGDSLNVGVDGITGKISSYNISWSDDKIPELSKDSIISQDKANQLLDDNLKLQPKYIPYIDQYERGDTTTQSLKLVYMLDTTNGISLDAKTGTMINNSSTTSAAIKVRDLDVSQKKSFNDSYKTVQKLSKELDSDSAGVIMKKIINEIYGNDYDIQSTSYQDYNNGFGANVSCWSGQFSKKDSSNNLTDTGSITIDSLTGQLVSINKFNPYEMAGSNDNNAQPKLSWEQAYDKAIEAVEKYFPDKVKDINTEQTYIPNTTYLNKTSQSDMTYGFNFNRLINGISYQNDMINIGFNAKTGEINQVYSSWSQNLQVPSTDGSMSLEEAQKIFFGKYTPELAYSLVNTSTDPNNSVMEVKIVYSIEGGLQFSQSNNIDAFTGKFLDYNGQEIDNNIAAFKAKINGNPLEKELSILASQGIIDTKDFDLSKQITRLDLIKMLVNVKGYMPYVTKGAADLKINYSGTKGDETYKYLQMAVIYGILDNSGSFNGDEKITREEMIKDIVKLAGYGKLAQAKDIFALTYSDISDITPDNIGYVAISKGLGLTNDTDNKFRPKDQVIITDAAFSIYKALDSLRNSIY
jgi:hypothetical protein